MFQIFEQQNFSRPVSFLFSRHCQRLFRNHVFR